MRYQLSRHRHHHHQHQCACGKRHAGAFRRIAHQSLEKLGNQDRGAEKHGAQDELKAHGGPEVAVLQQLQVDNRVRVSPFPPHKDCQRDHGQHERQGDVAIPEPVFLLALIENELQAANPDRHQAQPHCVDRAWLWPFL